MAASLQWTVNALRRLKEEGLERRLRVLPNTGGRLAVDGQALLNFASNDYLDLSHHPALLDAARQALDTYGTGATASRLMCGHLACHEALEQALASFKGYEAALVFGSGYMANVGMIPALVERGDWIVADRLAHASILDGAILSRAELRRFHHNDPAHLEQLLKQRPTSSRCLVVTESVFSMDGDLAPLKTIADVCERYGAMFLVDEAHATGVFGPCGEGVVSSQGLQAAVPLVMGTFSKAMGGYGGFTTCSSFVKPWFVNRARSFIFSTGLPPAVIGTAQGALDYLRHHPGLGVELLERAARFRQRLVTAGFDVGTSASQIVPLRVGDAIQATALSDALRQQGILAPAIRPPTVRPGTSRLRFSVTLAHTDGDLDRVVDALVSLRSGA